MFGKESFILAFILMPTFALADLASDWANAPMGIVITNCVYDTYGVSVSFETDLKPPYIVGVYESWEDGLGRNFPVAEVVTEKKSAYVAGDFTDVTTSAEVMHPSRLNPKMQHRVLTDSEKTYYRTKLEKMPVLLRSAASDRFSADIDWAPDNVMGQLRGMELTADHVWTGISYSHNASPTFSFKGRKAVDNVVTSQVMRVVRDTYWGSFKYDHTVEWKLHHSRTNDQYCAVDDSEPASYSSEYGPYDPPCKFAMLKHVVTQTPTGQVVERIDGKKIVDFEMTQFSLQASPEEASKGAGWRLVFNDETGETLAMRAYSSRTNCSNTVYLPRLFLGLNAHDGYRLTTDSNGVVICVPASNGPLSNEN